jgi:hypothetical protein
VALKQGPQDIDVARRGRSPQASVVLKPQAPLIDITCPVARHRRAWIETRIEHKQTLFAVDSAPPRDNLVWSPYKSG